jgi:hypothetical protein
MSNSQTLLDIIADLDELRASMIVGGQEGYAHLIRVCMEDLMWVYYDLTQYEE